MTLKYVKPDAFCDFDHILWYYPSCIRGFQNYLSGPGRSQEALKGTQPQRPKGLLRLINYDEMHETFEYFRIDHK